jgi:hypothetical protein
MSMEFAGPTQKPKIIIESRNQPTRTKILPKKMCLVRKSDKGQKTRIGATRRNSTPGPQKQWGSN